MSGNRRSGRRAFRPGLDVRSDLQLEPRLLLSTASVSAKSETFHKTKNIQARVAFGGKIAKIRDTDLELYDVVVVGPGHVLAKPMSGGRVMLELDGTTASTVVAVNPSGRHFRKGNAHHYPPGAKTGDGVLHIGDIKVNSGTIGEILGYQTAELDGTITAKSTAAINRIAFYSIQPGGSIITGGDLNALNTFKDLNIGGGPGISIGRDLNWLLVGGNVNVTSGSNFAVGRDIGLALQPPNGTDPGGQGGLIKGDFNVSTDSSFTVARTVDANVVIDGNLTGANQIHFGQPGAGTFIVRGTVTP